MTKFILLALLYLPVSVSANALKIESDDFFQNAEVTAGSDVFLQGSHTYLKSSFTIFRPVPLANNFIINTGIGITTLLSQDRNYNGAAASVPHAFFAYNVMAADTLFYTRTEAASYGDNQFIDARTGVKRSFFVLNHELSLSAEYRRYQIDAVESYNIPFGIKNKDSIFSIFAHFPF